MTLNIVKGFSLATLFLLVACGSKKIVIEPEPLPEDEQRISWQTNWDVGTGKGDDELYLNLQPGILETSTKPDVIYTADYRGRVMAIHVETGDVIWSTKIPDTNIVSGVGVGEHNIIMGTQEGEVIALNAQTGELQWRTQVSSEILSTPAMKDGMAAVLAVDSRVYGLAEDTGTIIWNAAHPAPLLKLRGGSSPLIHGHLVIVGFANGQIAIFDRTTGHAVWEETVAIPQGRSEVERMVDINGRMIIHGDTLYVVTYQGKLMAFDFAQHSVHWTKEMSSFVGLTGAENTVVVTDEDGVVWGLKSQNGEVLWQQTLLRHRELTTPSIIDNAVILGDDDGNVHLLSLANGEWLGYTRIDKSGIRAKPIVIGDTAYVYARDGELVSVTPQLQ